MFTFAFVLFDSYFSHLNESLIQILEGNGLDMKMYGGFLLLVMGETFKHSCLIKCVFTNNHVKFEMYTHNIPCSMKLQDHIIGKSKMYNCDSEKESMKDMN